MKKLLFSIAFMCAMFSNAQTLETKSSCDSDADGKVEVTDVTNTTRKLLGQAAKEKQVVTADDLNALLKKINSRLSAIEAKLGIESSDDSPGDDTPPVDPAASGAQNGHDYVDLGLSVKWAMMNVGATEIAGSKINAHTGKLDCYGEYFAWGETSPKDEYPYECKYCIDAESDTYSKYVVSGENGNVDEETTLEFSDDAARANWGGTWRMPTGKEIEELSNNCYWEWTYNYNGSGVNGYIIYKVKNQSDKGKYKNDQKSPTLSAVYSLTDTHIFLPEAGYRDETRFHNSGCYVWSSSRYLDGVFGASLSQSIWVGSDVIIIPREMIRSIGLSVRPVCP